ncbi:MAG: type II toxin-antitoxin system HipA family toxin [Proteobacteria bacterium]|nr:type II toxin-antitoxin system HipA family toxin [Pseudomonadota bacterium]
MVAKVDTAVVRLWGDVVGAVAWLEDGQYGVFEYDSEFVKKGLDISPIHMGLRDAMQGDRTFHFPGLKRETFLGLPGLLADSLPDKFGNSIIDAWLMRQGREKNSFSPVERLCYTGSRGMGALEFEPSVNRQFDMHVSVEVANLVTLAQQIMAERRRLDVSLGPVDRENADALMDIIRVGTSAGGARPKAIIAMNRENHIISGQGDVPEGYDYWILKFDGVDDLELGEPRGFGRIEYAYYLMAKKAGIAMSECRLLEENGRAHFLTQRFDRRPGEKRHLQSLCGLAHYDFNMAGAFSYEQAFSIMRKLRLSKADAVQQFRRMVFNVMARNQDDHTKNIAFLMGHDGVWRLSPAFDVTYSHNPAGKWTSMHQMSIHGKRDDFTLDDLVAVAESISISNSTLIIREILDAVATWPQCAREAGVLEPVIRQIAATHRRIGS